MPQPVSFDPESLDQFFAALEQLSLEDQRERALQMRELIQQDLSRLKSAMETRRTQHLDGTRAMDWTWWRRVERELRLRGNQILRVQDFLTRLARQTRKQNHQERCSLESMFLRVAQEMLQPAMFQLILAHATERLRLSTEGGSANAT